MTLEIFGRSSYLRFSTIRNKGLETSRARPGNPECGKRFSLSMGERAGVRASVTVLSVHFVASRNDFSERGIYSASTPDDNFLSWEAEHIIPPPSAGQ